MLAQGSTPRLQRLRRILLHSIDMVLHPLSPTDPPARTEPILVKKLRKGDGQWATIKTVLGWLLNTVEHAIRLPARRQERLTALLAVPQGKTHLPVKVWHQLLGELRRMTLTIFGLQGLFSMLQQALKTTVGGNVCLTKVVHRCLAANLVARPVRLREIVPTPTKDHGVEDAAKPGMGGVLRVNDIPCLWRSPFSPETQAHFLSCEQPMGTITNLSCIF